MSAKIVDLTERKVSILLEDLRLWILSQPHLNARIEDDFLRGFLRGCFYNLKETKRRIELYYTLKNEIPSVLADRRVNRRLLDICQMGVIIIDLPMFTNEKRARLHLSRYAHYNPAVSKCSEILKAYCMLSEIEMMESRNEAPSSVIHVIDLQGATFKHCRQFNIGLTRKIVRLIKAGLPYHIDEIHIINASSYFVRLLSFMCSFASKAIRQKFYLHSSMESLYKHIPQKYLPTEYGGRNGSIQCCIVKQMEKLMKYETYFEVDDWYGINESLRRKQV